MRVYGWQGWRAGRATREICAADSKRAVAKAAGVNRPNQLFNLGETGNAHECDMAMANPGRVFYIDLDKSYGAGLKGPWTLDNEPRK